jgi:acetyl-CoA acetyltransferase
MDPTGTVADGVTEPVTPRPAPMVDYATLSLGVEAARGALADAGVGIRDIGVLAAGTQIEAGVRLGQELLRQIGQTGIPVYNVVNACATGATALRTAILAVKAGECELGLAVGAEKISGAGLLAGRPRELDLDTWMPQGPFGALGVLDGRIGTDSMPGMFAEIGTAYDYVHGGATFELFARISVKNHQHSTLNPLATYQKALTLEQIMSEPMIAYPNTSPACSGNCDGGAAVVVVSEAKLRTLAPEPRRRAVKISASVLTSDPWVPGCHVLPDFNTLTRNAATQAYELAGVAPSDLDLVELHDCFATAELVHYDNLMLCAEGEAVSFFESGATWRDGALPVNVSGGLQSKGHPIAATGLANIYEIATHLRGEAGPRQIEGARVGLAHVAGLGQSCGVHILERAA